MPFEHSTFSFILQAHSSIKVTSKICPLIMPFSGDFHCQELHDYNDLVFSLIDSFLAQLEHSSPLKALNQYEFSALSESGKKFSSWAFQAGNPSPLVSVCLSRTLCFFSYAYFFQVPVTQAVLELAKSHWSLIYGGAVTKREGAYGSLFEKTKSALVTISKKGSCISSEAT